MFPACINRPGAAGVPKVEVVVVAAGWLLCPNANEGAGAVPLPAKSQRNTTSLVLLVLNLGRHDSNFKMNFTI